MHYFAKLVDLCTPSMFNTANKTWDSAIEELQSGSATRLVLALQVVRFQKSAFVVGMFSMCDAYLQDVLRVVDGFNEATRILLEHGEDELGIRFRYFRAAINVLKHGRGNSYNYLVAHADALPFKVKLPDECFFHEGDVSEICTLVEVDDAFVGNCVDVIRQVTAAVQKV